MYQMLKVRHLAVSLKLLAHLEICWQQHVAKELGQGQHKARTVSGTKPKTAGRTCCN